MTTGGIAEIYVMKKLHKERLRQMKMEAQKKNTTDGEVSQQHDEHRQGQEEGEGESTVSETCCFPLLQRRIHPRINKAT